MKVVILAGGLGSRISEETHLKPKPMIHIGGKPILWHIMKIFSSHGLNDFVICCGYKGYVIKEYFANYSLHMSDVTFCMKNNEMTVHHKRVEPWTVTLVDTGQDTLTGGRLKRVQNYLDADSFCFTYGDGVADIDVTALTNYHRQHGKMATVTTVTPPGRYGALEADKNGVVKKFSEKPRGDGGRINGGFFVLSPDVFERLDGDKTSWESDSLGQLVRDNQLMSFEHNGFWQPMDTLREKTLLEDLWESGKAPWKNW